MADVSGNFSCDTFFKPRIYANERGLFQAVVRRFLRDDHVMDV
jgi:hypothetical protein